MPLNADGIPDVSSDIAILLIAGLYAAVFGTVRVNVQVLALPIVVLPFFVVHLIVTVADVLDGILLAIDSGIGHSYEVLTLVAKLTYDPLPTLYSKV